MGYRDMLEAAFDYTKNLVEEKIGYTPVDRDHLSMLEAVFQDYGALSRQADLLGYGILDHLSGSPHEVKARKRIDIVRQATIAWMYDPMAGRAVDLKNDFVFGRGVPPPRARNDDVQAIIDGAWKDPDNAAVLTGYQAQMALGTDLAIQSNLFVLFFADGEDGKVKLSLLDHDTVFDVVRDPENRLRPLYYVATFRETEWDFQNNCVKPVDPSQMGQNGQGKNVRYYAHWKNVADAEADIEAGIRKAGSLPVPPPERMGEGVVYHIAVNRKSEMVFGVPRMQRTMRWFSAYNDLMSARVDMAKAAAELIMKRKVKGPATQLAKIAQGMIGRGGEIATVPEPTRIGGRPGGTVVENENVTHEGFKLDSGAGNAQMDATMIRSQVSAGTGLPQHYLGDQGNANLATATAMDLPVTKMVESEQELFEQLFRAFTDMVIERAVATGQLQGVLPGEEDAEVPDKSVVGEAKLNDGKKLDGSPDNEGEQTSGKTDLSYEFKMPNALRRLMSDLATTIQTIAKTFDPNGTNVELSRTLLTVALGEALELQDPSDAVARILPAGYQDPLIKMELEQGQMAQQQQMLPRGGDPAQQAQDSGLTMSGLTGGTPAAGGEPGSGKRGPYGTKSGATPPEKVKEALVAWAVEEAYQGRMETVDAENLINAVLALKETRFADLPESEQAATEERLAGMQSEFDRIVGPIAAEVVDSIPEHATMNGNH